MKINFKLSLIYLLSFMIISCAPDVKQPALPDIKPLLGPKQVDANLKFNADTRLYEKITNFSEQNISTPEILNTIETLWSLSFKVNKPAMINFAQQLQTAVYGNSENIKTVSFDESPYAQALLNETQSLVKPKLEEVLKRLEIQQRLIGALLDARTGRAAKNSRASFLMFPTMVKEKLFSEIDYMNKNEVDPLIIETIKKTVLTEVLPSLDDAVPAVKTVIDAKSLQETLVKLEQVFAILKYTPQKEILDQLILGHKISHAIDTMETEQAGLTLIIQFWRMMTPAQRIEHIRNKSIELYDYLKERSDSDLTCLASDSCLNVILLIGKKRIFAGIREYGFGNLQAAFNRGAHTYVIDLVEETLPGEIALIPQEMKRQIIPRVAAKSRELLYIHDNYESFLKKTLSGWAKKNISVNNTSMIPLMEKHQLRWTMKNGIPTVNPMSESIADFKGQTFGASFSVTAQRWNALYAQPNPTNGPNANLMTNMLEQINKLLLTYDQRPLENKTDIKKQFNALNTAELIRGLSLISTHLRDYEKTIFDAHLGKITVANLHIEDIPQDISEQSLFPKDTFFALAIGNAALQLQALTSNLSPLFTVDTENKIHWLDKMEDNPKSPNVMAGVVDIINGKRAQMVECQSLSKFLSALIEFYKATENLGQTKASRLLEKNSNGKSNVEIILENREQIHDLILGLSNFLSHQIKNENGASLHSIDINETLVKTTGTVYLDDQIGTIEALLDSYELLQTNMYLWSAIDTYYAMNQSLWNPTADFYFSDSQKNGAKFSQRISALHAIARLKEYLPEASQKQAERILHVNTKAFGK
jgi:hypothetical protein